MANKLSKIAKAAAPQAVEVSKREQDRWRAEDDLRTITRAQEIQRDSGRMRAVKTIAKEQMKTLSSVCKR